MKIKFLVFLAMFFIQFTLVCVSQNAAFDWAKQSGTGYGYSVTTDLNGNAYYVGGTTIFKLDSNGNSTWSKSIDATISTIVTDNSSNLFAIGAFTDTVDFDPGVNTYNLFSLNAQMFILKLDASGDFVWAKKFEGPGSSIGFAFSLDNVGNIYITGEFTDTVDFDPGPNTYPLISHFLPGTLWADLYVSKLDSNGNFIWAKSFAASNNAENSGRAIKCENTQNVFIAGTFMGTLDFDPGINIVNLTTQTETTFILKLDSSGNYIWVRKFDIIGNGDCRVTSMCLDNRSNIYLTGSYRDTVDFDPGPIVYNLNSTIGGTFISKLDSSGSYLWAKNPEGVSYGRSIDLDNFDNIYITGLFSDTVDFDPGPNIFKLISPSNYGSTFISKCDSSGNFIWAKKFQGTDAVYGLGIDVDNIGNIYTTGQFHDTTDFDPSLNTFLISTIDINGDGFINKLKPCSNTYSTITQSYCDSVIINGQSFYISGIYSQLLNNANGCDSIITLDLQILDRFYPTICLVTVDSTSNYNQVVWEKPPGLITVDSFYVYREITFNNYQKVGAVHADSLSIFNDFGANPNSSSYKYKITALDTCGIENPMSLFHSTIQLQYLGLGNFQWTSYQIESTPNSVASYNFYRDDNSTGNFQLLQVIPGGNNTFTDINYLTFPNASYRVDVAWISGGICNPTRSAFSTSISNIKSLASVDIKPVNYENDIFLYPSPANNFLNIDIKADLVSNWEFELIDAMGQITPAILLPQKNNKTTLTQINTEDLKNGIYLLILKNSKKQLQKRFIVNH